MSILKTESNEEFIFKYYFHLYKDFPSTNRHTFRKMFHRNHGIYPKLNKLILKIQNYQVKRYGETLKF